MCLCGCVGVMWLSVCGCVGVVWLSVCGFVGVLWLSVCGCVGVGVEWLSCVWVRCCCVVGGVLGMASALLSGTTGRGGASHPT